MNNLDNCTNRKTEESETKKVSKNLINSANQKIEEPIKTKEDNKKENACCKIVSEQIMEEKEVRSCKKATSNALETDTKNAKRKKPCNNAYPTSVRDIEQIQSNEETKDKRCNKKSKICELQSIDEIFDSLEENLQHKVDLKLQRAKKKLEINSKKQQEKMKKQGKKKKKEDNKDNEDIPDLEFKNFEPRPILDQPLDETTTTENVQKDNLTNLKATVNIEQELVNKSSNRETEIDPDKYLNIKPKYLKTQLPDVTDEGEYALDNNEQEEETHKIMSEAFADDDVVEEFRKEKEEEVCC